MSYTVLARRYRSQTFDDVIGQEAVARTLKNAIAANRVAHAYLFTGTRGVGKTTMARILAKALNCLNSDKPTPTPCCQCDSCLAVAEGEDLDVIEIDGASHTGVEHIRELRQNAIYKPARARHKIYIIDEVHMLSTSAFNALLKTLEEPPEHVKFIMATTEPNKVLATIQSRCQRFDFRNIRGEDIVHQLRFILDQEHIEAEDTLIHRVARLARGSMRDALSLLDQLMSMADGPLTVSLLADLMGTPGYERIFALTDAMAQGNLPGTLAQLDQAIGEGLSLEQITEALQTHFRDLMIMRHCGADSELAEMDDPQLRLRMAATAQQFDEATLVYYITVIEELRRAIKAASAGRALVEATLVRMTLSERFSDVKTLLDQLAHLPPSPTGPAAPPPRARATPVPAAAAPSKPPAAAAFTPPAHVDLHYLRQQWPVMVQEVSQRGGSHLAVYLRAAFPTAYEPGQITLGFAPIHKGFHTFLRNKPEYLREFSNLLGSLLNLSLEILLGDVDEHVPASAAAETPAAPAVPAKRTPSPGAKPSQQEINDAMNDPQVRQVQSILGGKVKQIERTTQELF